MKLEKLVLPVDSCDLIPMLNKQLLAKSVHC